MGEPVKKWAIFDLDGTLIPLPSAEWRFACHLYRQGVLDFSHLLNYGRFLLKHWSDLGLDARRINKAYLKGFSEQDIQRLAADFVERFILPIIRPKTLKALREHQRRGELVVLLSGTMAPIAKALARHLDISAVIATEASIENGRYTDRPPIIHPYGKRKKQLAEQFAMERGLSLADATIYADVFADSAILAAAGQAVATYPSAKLRQVAQRHAWQILE